MTTLQDIYSRYGLALNGSLPGASSTSQAPTFSGAGLTSMGQQTGGMNPMSAGTLNYGLQDPRLQGALQTAGAGTFDNGVNAFLGTGYNFRQNNGSGADAYTTYNTQPLLQLAQGLGYDLSDYARTGDAESLYRGLNDYTKDYYGAQHLSQQFTGSPDDRQASRTLYRNENGSLNPVTDPVYYHQREQGNWFQENPEFASIVSTILPAFGGWAGMLGNGAAGTLSAGSGLGLTSGLGSAIGAGASNALVNAGMGSLLNGSGGQGFLGSLAGSAFGAAGNSIMNRAGGLGAMFNPAGAGNASFNPWGALNGQYNTSGLGGSPLGLAGQFGAGITGGGGMSPQNAAQAVGGLAGGYLGNQFGGQLGGTIGSAAGRGLGSMFPTFNTTGYGDAS